MLCRLSGIWLKAPALQHSLTEPELHPCRATPGLGCRATSSTALRSHRLSERPRARKTEQNTEQEAQLLFNCFLFTQKR